MPEFCLNDNGDAHVADEIDGFTLAYIEAFMWTNCDSGHEKEFLANELGTRRITKKSMADIISDCAAFQAHAKPLLDQAYDRDGYDEDQAGRDFWLTRQGHGVGFWDRKMLDEDNLGDHLSKLAKAHGEKHMCQIYNGWIYHG